MKSHVLSFLSFLKTKKIPNKDDISTLREAQFSVSKVGIIIVIIFIVSIFLSILVKLSSLISVEVPDYGGTISHGVIGAPKYINPLLATSETDKLISSLVYGGLMKKEDDDSLSPLLAENCVSNPEQTSYQCTLKKNLVFSNKTPLTSSDVVFTFETKKALSLALDPISSWRGISVQAINPETLSISTSLSKESLKEKMTLGIVPKSLWESVPLLQIKESTLNMEPVGAGTFLVNRIRTTNTIPTEVILKKNPHFITKPFVDTFIIRSFANQLDLKSALVALDIDSTDSLRGTFINDEIKKSFSIKNIPTKKEVSLYINQKQKGTQIYQTLKSLSPFIDRIKIIDIIENGYGIPLVEDTSRSDSNIPKITGTEVPISIAVQKDEDLIKTAEILSEYLKSFGIISTVNVFDQGIFTDQLSLGSFSFVLGSSIDETLGYQHLIPLYTKTLVHLSSKDIYTKTPTSVESLHESLRDAPLWYSRTDLVWKWFTHNI